MVKSVFLTIFVHLLLLSTLSYAQEAHITVLAASDPDPNCDANTCTVTTASSATLYSNATTETYNSATTTLLTQWSISAQKGMKIILTWQCWHEFILLSWIMLGSRSRSFLPHLFSCPNLRPGLTLINNIVILKGELYWHTTRRWLERASSRRVEYIFNLKNKFF